jgi:hypothetical protein
VDSKTGCSGRTRNPATEDTEATEGLEREESELIEPDRSYAIWSPDRAFWAADALLRALEDEKGHRVRKDQIRGR